MYDMKTPVHFQPDQSFQSLQYTFAFSKYSCVAWIYPLHITFAYLVVLTGALAMLSRVVDKLRPYHAAFGRWYLIFMFWCMASSLLIHTSGLPFPIIISFLYLLFSITIGWNSIKVHTSRIQKQAISKINQKIKSFNFQIPESYNIEKDIQTQKSQILRSKSFMQRLFSFKMLHGVVMSFSWYQMAGRLMVTNPLHFNGCWSYPAYKSESVTNKVFAVDSVSSPAFPMDQTAFLALITVPTVVIIAIVAVLTTYWFYKVDMKSAKVSSQSESTISDRLTEQKYRP